MASQAELTPCGAMFDIFKRAAHLSHIELCGLVLSSRPLADGRSPQSRAADRSWVSRFIVRAPVGTLQERYFADYGTSAARIMSHLALRRRNPMNATAVINMVCGPAGEPMVRALEECHQDTSLYRNAVERLSQAAELMPAERAEAVLVLFVAVGCSADVRSSVTYAIDYAHATCGGATSTPQVAEYLDGHGRSRGGACASAGPASRAKRLRGERSALDSAEWAGRGDRCAGDGGRRYHRCGR